MIEKQTFRVVGPKGRVRRVTVGRTETGWGERSFAAAYECHHDTPREAVDGYVAAMGWPVAAVFGPGDVTP